MSNVDQILANGQYNTSAPSPGAGASVPIQTDSAGNLQTRVVNGVAAGTAGTASANVVTMQGIAGMTPLQEQSAAGGQLTPYTLVAPATPAAEEVYGSPGQILWLHAANILSTPVYLKFFDGAPTLGSTSAKWQVIVPGEGAGGAGIVAPIPHGMKFLTSIYCAVTGAIALADDTAITASSVLVSLGYSA
jgi:hypothetical protein